MLEPSASETASPRAFLRVGGKSLARHQLALVLALECQRIVCVAREVGPDIIALQHEAEKAGARFHVVTGARGLSGLVTANDEILALADGALMLLRDAEPLIEGGYAVLGQPVETGLAGGFERLDINHAAGGIIRVPGRLVEKLNELPPDCDVLSALTRIALQAGVPLKTVPAEAREGWRWSLVRSETDAHEAEDEWFRMHMVDGQPTTVASLLARLGIHAIGPALLHGGSGARSLAFGSLAVVLLAMGFGWFGWSATGLGLCGMACVVRRMAVILERISHDSLTPSRSFVLGDKAIALCVDLALIAIVIWSQPADRWDTLIDNVFPLVILLATARLLPRISMAGWTAWVEDRFLLAFLLMVASLCGVLHPATQGLALLLVVIGTILAGGHGRLTTI